MTGLDQGEYMLETIQRSTSGGLAYEKHGDGVPIVFLHGLTFDRTTWRLIIERLGEDVCSIAFDLPGHGETGGAPCTLRETAARVNAALDSMGIDQPVIVGALDFVGHRVDLRRVVSRSRPRQRRGHGRHPTDRRARSAARASLAQQGLRRGV